MSNQLSNYISKCVKLSDEALNEVNAFFEYKKISKKSIILSEGEVCKYESFVLNGCIKTYFVDNNGFEVILTFATENWWVSDLTSFQDMTPSKMYIEAIEDSELLVLTLEAKTLLLTKYPALEKMFRLMVQRHLASYQERLFANIALTAEERYNQFLQKFPDLPLRIPQHLIASYLGISPEFLSRLRSRKANK